MNNQSDTAQISLDKRYKTRDGKEVMLLLIDDRLGFPVMGAYNGGNQWFRASWDINGAFYSDDKIEHNLDLTEVKPERKVLVFVHSGTGETTAGLPKHWAPWTYDTYEVTLSEENKVQ